MSVTAEGSGAGLRRLNGPQTTGRTYRSLSEVRYAMTCDADVRVPMRDGAVGTTTRNAIQSSSRLLLPVTRADAP